MSLRTLAPFGPLVGRVVVVDAIPEYSDIIKCFKNKSVPFSFPVSFFLRQCGAHQLRWAASRRLDDRRMLVKRPCSEARFAPRHKAANAVSAAFRRTSEARPAERKAHRKACVHADPAQRLVTRFICFLSNSGDHDSNFHENQS